MEKYKKVLDEYIKNTRERLQYDIDIVEMYYQAAALLIENSTPELKENKQIYSKLLVEVYMMLRRQETIRSVQEAYGSSEISKIEKKINTSEDTLSVPQIKFN